MPGIEGKSGTPLPPFNVKTSNWTASPATIFPLTIVGYISSFPSCNSWARTLVGFGTYLEY